MVFFYISGKTKLHLWELFLHRQFACFTFIVDFYICDQICSHMQGIFTFDGLTSICESPIYIGIIITTQARTRGGGGARGGRTTPPPRPQTPPSNYRVPPAHRFHKYKLRLLYFRMQKLTPYSIKFIKKKFWRSMPPDPSRSTLRRWRASPPPPPPAN